MFDGAKAVFSGALAIAAVLIVLWVIGIINHPGAHGMTAVGDGISAVFTAAIALLSSIHF